MHNYRRIETITFALFKEITVRLASAEQVNEALAKYIGGQAEIQNLKQFEVMRGEIKSISVKGNLLRIRFVWLAKFCPGNTWTNEKNLEYETNFIGGSVDNVGPSPSHVGGSDRLKLQSRNSRDFIVLFPPDGSKLDPKMVQGLQLTQK